MDILVTAKRTIDYTVQIHVKQDQSGVEAANVKMSMNPFDAIALEQAIVLKEQGVAKSVTLLTIGSQLSQDILRQGLAMGADEAVLIETDVDLNPLEVANCLKSYLGKRSYDLVLMGKQSIDNDCNQTGQMLAGMMDWPQVTFASKIEVKSEGSWHVTREMDAGLEVLEVCLPAVITCDLRLNEPRYPTLPNILKAKQKPIETISLSEYHQVLDTRPKQLKVCEPSPRVGGGKLTDINELFEKLKDLGYV